MPADVTYCGTYATFCHVSSTSCDSCDDHLLHWTLQCVCYNDTDSLGPAPGKWSWYWIWTPNVAWHLCPLSPCLSPHLSLLVLLGPCCWICHCHVTWTTCCPTNVSSHMHVLDASYTLKSVSSSAGQMMQQTRGIFHKQNCSNNDRSLYGSGTVLSSFTMYMQIGQQNILVFCPYLASSGVNISMHKKVSRECSSCRSPSRVTLPPSNTMMVKGHPRSFAPSPIGAWPCEYQLQILDQWQHWNALDQSYKTHKDPIG